MILMKACEGIHMYQRKYNLEMKSNKSMKYFLITILFFTCAVFPLFGQTSNEEKADQYEKLGNYNDAIVYYTLALDGLSGEGRLDIVGKRANCYQQNDNLTSALADYSEIVEFYRKNPDRLKFMNSKSKNDYIDFQFDFMNPLFFRATSLFYLERVDEALNELNQYIQLAEFNYGGMMYLTALEFRGLGRAQNQDMTGACSDWKKATDKGNESAADLYNKYCKN